MFRSKGVETSLDTARTSACATKMLRHIPNLISLARLLLTPLVLYLLHTQKYVAALLCVMIAAFTDYLDGALARRLNVQSRLGRMLEPIADNALLSGTFLIMTIDAMIPRWLGAIVIGRDLAILLAAGLMLLFTKTRREFPPSIWGKISTGVQIGYIFGVLTTLAGFPWGWLVGTL